MADSGGSQPLRLTSVEQVFHPCEVSATSKSQRLGNWRPLRWAQSPSEGLNPGRLAGQAFDGQPSVGPNRIYPHLLRHSFATQMLPWGMNPIQLKDILGHSSLAMLDRVYSHLAPTDAYQALIEALREE